MMGDWIPTPDMASQNTGNAECDRLREAAGVAPSPPLRKCPHCGAWVRLRLDGGMVVHRGQSPWCEAGGELPWPWENEAMEKDFGFNGRWKKASLAGSWFPAANWPRKIDEWYLCRRRIGATSLQFGPMHLRAAVALADHLNAPARPPVVDVHSLDSGLQTPR